MTYISSKDGSEYRAGKTTSTIMAKVYPSIVEDFIRNSFFVPIDAMRSSNWEVKPIRVITGQQFDVLRHAVHKQHNADVKLVLEGASPHMLVNAKHVGVSERNNSANCETILVCKLWYGRIGNQEQGL